MRALGNKGEDQAAKYLKKKGYRILERNFSTPRGEVDIIALDGDTLVFVEVKGLSRLDMITPEQKVNRKKQKKIANTALIYMAKLGSEYPLARFDVISVHFKWFLPRIVHIKDAFELDSYAG
jgi:putative endonuclease